MKGLMIVSARDKTKKVAYENVTASVKQKEGLICGVGQNRKYTLYMTVCMVISLPNIPYIHRIYL